MIFPKKYANSLYILVQNVEKKKCLKKFTILWMVADFGSSYGPYIGYYFNTEQPPWQFSSDLFKVET